MTSEALAQFIASVEKPITSRAELEDFDLYPLGQLEGDEITRAEDLLIGLLDGPMDPRVPRALVAIGSPRAIEAVRAGLTRGWPDYTKFECARIMWERERSPEAKAVIGEIASEGIDEPLRYLAADALRSM